MTLYAFGGDLDSWASTTAPNFVVSVVPGAQIQFYLAKTGGSPLTVFSNADGTGAVTTIVASTGTDGNAPGSFPEFWSDQTSLFASANGGPRLKMRSAAGGTVSSVAGKTGVVTLVASDVGLGSVPNVDATLRANHTGTQSADTITNGSVNHAYSLAEATKLAGITAGANVTNSTTVTAAGAVMKSATATTGFSFVDNDTALATNSSTMLATQHAVKTYVDAAVVGGAGGATSLTGLTDVTISGPINGQVLTYNSSTGKWTNQTPSGSGTGWDVLVTVTSDGATNMAPTIQAVLTALSSSSHSMEVIVQGSTKTGKIYLNSQVKITTDNTKLRFKNPVLMGTNADSTLPNGEGCLSIMGSVQTTTTVTSGATRGSSKIGVSSTASMATTRLIRIVDNDSSGGSASGDKSEMAEIVDISGSTLYLNRPLSHNYTGTITCELVNAVTNSGFEDAVITFTGQQVADFVFPAKMQYVRHCYFRNLHFKGDRNNSWSRECISTRYAFRCTSEDCSTSFSWDYNVNSEFCYGMSTDGSTECRWINCWTNNLRHGFTADKGTCGAQYVGCHAGNVLNTGFDSHGGFCWDLRYTGCTADASITYPSDDGQRFGFLAGDTTYSNGDHHVTYSDCEARNFLPYTRGGAGGSGDGAGFGVVSGCSNITWRGCKVYDSESGWLLLSEENTAAITSIQILDCEAHNLTDNPVYIHAGLAPNDVNGVLIDNFRIIGSTCGPILLNGTSGNTISDIQVLNTTWNQSPLTSGQYAIEANYVDGLIINNDVFHKTGRGVKLTSCAKAIVTNNVFDTLTSSTDASNTIFDGGSNTSFVFRDNTISNYFPNSWSTAINSTGAYVEFLPAIRTYATGTLPSAAVCRAGSGPLYQSTASKPVWSNGTNWRDATGTVVT